MLISDEGRADILEEGFEKHRPSIVFHAGMRKYNSIHFVDFGDIGRTNYLRTFNLARTAAKWQCDFFVMISSMEAAYGGNYIADSLRIAEISLEVFFAETKTQFVVTRLCDIIENRGGVLAIMGEQIRKRNTVLLPSRDSKALFVSKESAADFILQSLVEVKRSKFDRHLFAFNAGSPVLLVEVAKKLACLYGLNPDYDLTFQFADQTNGNTPISAQNISASTGLYGDPLVIENQKSSQGGYSESLKSVIKDFVGNNDIKPGFQDWRERTKELLAMCGQICK
jgi:FlaA1/EpsC-like NDP-sugar epimerase